MLLEKARIEELIEESGERKDTNGNSLIGEDGKPLRWTRRSIRVRQDQRGGDYGVLSLTRNVEENQEVMQKLLVGAIVTIEVGLSYREYNGRYFNDVAAWRIDVVTEAPI